MNVKWLLLASFLVVLNLFGWFLTSEKRVDTSAKLDTPTPLLETNEQIEESQPSPDSITALGQVDRESLVFINGVKHRLKLANLSKQEMQEIVEVATNEDNERFPLEGEDIPEINSEKDAFMHFYTRISLASVPSTFFTVGGDYYFSGGGGTEEVDDFSEGFLVTKDGQIRSW